MGLQIVYNGDPIFRLLWKAKDGGPDSNVTGYWLIECKRLFSIALLKFAPGSREAFHSHAFNALSWILRGKLREEVLIDGDFDLVGSYYVDLPASFKPVYTPRDRTHRVYSEGTTWAITFRGPWAKTWREFFQPKLGRKGKWVTLSDGRVVEA